jgi:hypothetical protein
MSHGKKTTTMTTPSEVPMPAVEQLPTMPGLVDGIVSMDPPRVQCRGCGVIATGVTGKAALLILTSGILFHVADGRTKRLCAACRAGCTCATCRH